jgi:hypothetical protein
MEKTLKAARLAKAFPFEEGSLWIDYVLKVHNVLFKIYSLGPIKKMQS